MLAASSMSKAFRIFTALALAACLAGAMTVISPQQAAADGPVILSPAAIDLDVTPNTVINDASGDFYCLWTISDLANTAWYYKFQILKPDKTVLWEQDSISGNTVPGVLEQPLASIDGLSGVDIHNPEWASPHVYSVIWGREPGGYTVRIEFYSYEWWADFGTYEASADVSVGVEQAKGNITICKYDDLNRNGARDAGEPGLPGWQFQVCGPEHEPGPPCTTVTTGADGCVTLSGINIGNYTITETVKPNWVPTDPSAGPPFQKRVELTTNASLQVVFGNRATGDLTICKYDDVDGSGTKDAGETMLPGWQFQVCGPEYPGCTTVTTGSNGCVTLGGIAVGDYTVTEVLQPNWECTDPGGTAPFQKSAPVTVGGSASLEFGNMACGNLTVFKYNDLNANGSWDAGEPGLENWEFTISGPAFASEPGGQVTSYTDANGLIELGEVSVGEYLVVETLQAGWQNTEPGGSAPYQKQAMVLIGALTRVEFGNRATGGLQICKYDDRNGNGARDAGEPGLPNWQFQVCGPEYPGCTMVTTGSDGCVTLSGIAIGSYTITETLKNGWVCTDPGAGLQKSDDVTVDTLTTVEFGNKAIGDLKICKYNDLNGNGVWNTPTEPGLAGWQFEVCGPEYAGCITVTTGADGCVTLTGILVGTYTITESLQAGWECTDPGPGLQDSATVTTGGSIEVDFGNRACGDLVVFKYEDLNGNGNFDSATESGLAGWEFRICGPEYASLPDGCITAVTDGNGFIRLTCISVGDYTVTEKVKRGWRCTTANPQGATIMPGGSETLEFGNQRPPMVPALSQWGIIAMIAVFGGLVVWAGRRRLAHRTG